MDRLNKTQNCLNLDTAYVVSLKNRISDLIFSASPFRFIVTVPSFPLVNMQPVIKKFESQAYSTYFGFPDFCILHFPFVNITLISTLYCNQCGHPCPTPSHPATLLIPFYQKGLLPESYSIFNSNITINLTKQSELKALKCKINKLLKFIT